jgi:hypothetical protein
MNLLSRKTVTRLLANKYLKDILYTSSDFSPYQFKRLRHLGFLFIKEKGIHPKYILTESFFLLFNQLIIRYGLTFFDDTKLVEEYGINPLTRYGIDPSNPNLEQWEINALNNLKKSVETRKRTVETKNEILKYLFNNDPDMRTKMLDIVSTKRLIS